MQSSYEVSLFREKGFSRKKCKKCKRFFWSSSTDKESCGEPPCEEYSFIGNSPMKKKLNLHEMREFFLNFFEKNGHKRISRYPTVARWRNDTFFTIASISCFQPWVLNRTIQPPANPLVMSQTCLRFNDIDNVGKTGRHLTLFEMLAHHCFNTKENFVYFKDKTVELCQKFLISLGIDDREVAYIESEWTGGGNSGPCFEVVVKGAEIATLVFMMYEDTKEGKKKEMEMQVVDTGYGLERFTWVSLGKPSIYEAIFGDVLKKLKSELKIESDEKILAEYSKLAGMISSIGKNLDLKKLRERVAKTIGTSGEKLEKYITPFENLYAICDHTKALMFMLNDGIVPSNVKAGYFARLLARRTLRALKFLNLNVSLAEIVSWQIDSFKKNFPELERNKEDIKKLLDEEEKKYKKTIIEGSRIVKNLEKELMKEGIRRINEKELISLYDTHGLTPEVVKEFSSLSFNIPEDFYIKVAALHEKPEEECEEEKEEKIKIPKNIPETKLGFYENANVRKFKANIIANFNSYIVLNKTYFYAEGGGQEGDTGRIDNLNVIDTKKVGNVILHKIEGSLEKIKVNQIVNCEINWKRRLQLMQHHSATHIINGAARKVLGNHVWQAGAHKSEELGRLDITHYRNLSNDELKKIESLANKIVLENRDIEIKFMPRDEAEKNFGFGIYQGGAVPGKIIRIVNIKDWDVEACGGTHFSCTKEVGAIKLIRAKRIQDGVVRLEFKTGEAFKKYEKEISLLGKKMKRKEKSSMLALSENELKEIGKIFSVPLEQVPKTLERFENEWFKQRKEIEELEKKILELSKGKEKYKKYKISEKYKESPLESVYEKTKKLFQEWKSQKKELEKLREDLGKILREGIKEKFKSKKFEEFDGVKIVKEVLSCLDTKNLIEIGKSTIEKNSVIILGNINGEKASIVVVSNSKLNAKEICEKIAKSLGGGASGNEKLAVGGGSSKNIKEVFEKFRI